VVLLAEGETLVVALLHNSGGYQGAYSGTLTHFEGPWGICDGVAVQFMKGAAEIGRFQMKMVEPPDWLVNETFDSL